MDLSDLPQFAVAEIQDGPTPGENVYRHGAVSVVGDLRSVPESSDEQASFLTPDAALAPELGPGSTYPWLDGYWQPRHVAMVMASAESWSRRSLAATPAATSGSMA